jgi:hypothetical protein
MANVALTRIKAEGKYYLPGEEIAGDLEDAESLTEKGVVGSAADAAKQKKEREDAASEAEEAQAEADRLQAEADDLKNKAAGVLVPPVSVTDQEAAELNKTDEEEVPTAKPTAAKSDK